MFLRGAQGVEYNGPWASAPTLWTSVQNCVGLEVFLYSLSLLKLMLTSASQSHSVEMGMEQDVAVAIGCVMSHSKECFQTLQG